MPDKQVAKKRTGLGGAPLGLFSPTTDLEGRGLSQHKESKQSTEPKDKVVTINEPKDPSQERSSTSSQNIEHSFLVGVEGYDKESIGLQVTTEVNDWLDQVVKASRRKHGKKLKKQVIIQAGVELLRSMPVDWTDVGDLDELRRKLRELSAAVENHKI